MLAILTAWDLRMWVINVIAIDLNVFATLNGDLVVSHYFAQMPLEYVAMSRGR